MARPGSPWRRWFPWALALWAWAPGASLHAAPAPAPAPAAATPAPQTAPPALGVLVAQTFLRAVTEGDLRTAAPLCAEAVDFDGERVQGAEAVRARLGKIPSALKEGRVLRKIVVMRLGDARRLFGPPPARLKIPTQGEVLVGFGRFTRGGLIVFVAPERDRFRVVALTD